MKRAAQKWMMGLVVMLAGSCVFGQGSPTAQAPAATASATSQEKPKAATPAKEGDAKKATAGPTAKKKATAPKAAAGAKKSQGTGQTGSAAGNKAAPVVPAGKSAAPAPKQIVPAGKPAAPVAKPVVPASKKTQTGAPGGKPGAKAAVKPKTPAKSAKKTQEKPAAKPPAPSKPVMEAGKPAVSSGSEEEAPPSPAEPPEGKLIRRDPFRALIGANKTGTGRPSNLPAGIAGLQVNGLRVDGVVRAPNGMIAVVSNDQARTYFLREGDQLYDGRVEKIMMDSVSFHEVSKDAFGRPVERQVIKRIYSKPGETQ